MNIALVGFMGAGKTVIGRRLAQLLGYCLLDTDALIARNSGMAIPELFSTKGEEHFRQLEREVLASLQQLDNHVIATGGGLPVQPGAMEALKQASFVIFLRPPSTEVLLERLRRNDNRPMLQKEQPDWEEKILELYASRQPAYEQAHLILESGQESVPKTAKRLLGEILKQI